MKRCAVLFTIALLVVACKSGSKNEEKKEVELNTFDRLQEYVEVELKTDLSHLSDKEKQMIPLLIDVAQIMDDIFWTQASGKRTFYCGYTRKARRCMLLSDRYDERRVCIS
jgi:predicted component of type VI protein secretion system